MEIVARYFEKVIIFSLILLMMLVILVSAIEFGYILIMDIFMPPALFLEIDELLDIFGFFLLILIGVELLETIRAYLREHVVHVEVVVEVALIAIARKVIILDVQEVPADKMLGIAAIVVALAVAFFLMLYMRTHTGIKENQEPASKGTQ